MNIEKNNIKSILIIRRKNIGDIICAIPVFKAIRREFPFAFIAVMTDEISSGILKGASFVDDVILYKKETGIYKNKYIACWKMFRDYKRNFDIAIALKPKFSSFLASITYLSGAKLRVGCLPHNGWHPLQKCYNLPISYKMQWSKMHIIDALGDFTKTIGIISNYDVRDISIEINPDSIKRVEQFFEKNKINNINNIVVLNISCNKPENLWGLNNFKKLSEILFVNYKALCIITSTQQDKESAVSLSKKVSGSSFYFETPTIMDFAALVSKSNLLICGEGGAMHIGVAVDIPTISLWSTLRPLKWKPIGSKHYVIRNYSHVNHISVEYIMNIINDNNLLQK